MDPALLALLIKTATETVTLLAEAGRTHAAEELAAILARADMIAKQIEAVAKRELQELEAPHDGV